MAYTWAKDYVKLNGNNADLVYIFLSGCEGISKSHLLKEIYNAILKHCFVIVNATGNLDFFTCTYKNISGKYRRNNH